MLAVYCVVVNTAIAASPSEQFTQTQVQNFVSTEKSLSISSLADSVEHGATLPNWAPYGQLFMVGNCSGLYMASGITETNVPGLQIDHYTWIPVEQNPAFTHGILVHLQPPRRRTSRSRSRLMTYGASRLVLEPAGRATFSVDLEHSGTPIRWPSTDLGAKAHLGAPRALPVASDNGSQPAPDRGPLVRDVLHHPLISLASGPPVVHATHDRAG